MRQRFHRDATESLGAVPASSLMTRTRSHSESGTRDSSEGGVEKQLKVLGDHRFHGLLVFETKHSGQRGGNDQRAMELHAIRKVCLSKDGILITLDSIYER